MEEKRREAKRDLDSGARGRSPDTEPAVRVIERQATGVTTGESGGGVGLTKKLLGLRNKRPHTECEPASAR